MRIIPFNYMKNLPCLAPYIVNQTTSIPNNGSFTLSISTVSPPNFYVTNGETTYTWTYANNPNVTGAQNQPVRQLSVTGGPLTNLTGTNQIVVYTITPYNGSCTGTTFTNSVTVRP